MDLVARRRRWAYGLIRKAQKPPPTYGSEAWLALPEEHPEKVGAVVIAAEAWAVDGDFLADRLARELEDRRRAEKRAEDADYQARHREHRERWGRLSLVRPRYEGQEARPLEEIGREHTARERGAK